MPELISETQIFKIKLLRNILILFLAVATALSIYNIYFIYPSLTELIIENTKQDAVRAAKYLARTFISDKTGEGQSAFDPDNQDEVQNIIETFELDKLKVFSNRGEVIFSSDPQDIGTLNQAKYFQEIVEMGNVHAIVVQKNSRSLEGRTMTVDVVETYVPQMRGDTFLGAFEIYYDITDRKEKFDTLLALSSKVLSIGVVGLLSAIILVWVKENRAIKERRQMEKALVESEAKLKGILNSFTDFVILIDRDLKIAWANLATAEFFGADPVGKNYHDVFPPAKPPHGINRIEKCFEACCGVEEEIECTTAGGKRMDFWFTASVAEWSKDGESEMVIAVYRDITEKKQLRAEAIRSGRLASIGELAAGVAHEINNPVNGIINCAQLLIDESKEDSQQGEIFHRIIKAGGRIAVIVRNLLSFARDTQDEPRRVTIKDILSDALDLTEAQIKKDGIGLGVEIPDTLPKVRVRSHQMQQVILNILSNAKFAVNQIRSNTRNKIIEIKGESIDIDNRPHLRLIFYDNGIGIPSEIMDRLCDPFFSTKPQGEGTGLGLSISHAIIKDHGGRLDFDSVDGAYTRVIIDLPASLSEDDFEG